MRFLSIGECMVELAPAGASDTFRRGFAGDTFNTAWYLRSLRADIDCAYLTAVGSDPLSDRFIAFARDAGIDTGAIMRRSDRAMGLYMISVDHGERSFAYWRAQSAARTLADDAESLSDRVSSSDLIYFSGITVAILDDAGRGHLLDALRSARSAGRRIAFDPNLRPALWRTEDEMRHWITLAARVSDISLPSFEDEERFFDDATPGDTLKRYAELGASDVIVKNGPGNVAYRTANGSGEVTIEPAENVVDTTSAGDSFNAGYFAMLDRTDDMAERIRSAANVARKVVAAPGALVRLNDSTRA